MSPEIRIKGKIIADVPDDTGWHRARDGTPLYINTDSINADGEWQLIQLMGSSVGGIRMVGLTLDGRGESGKTNKGSDGKTPNLEVTLHDRPIRVTYNPRVWVNDEHLTGGPESYYYKERVTRHNPRWVRGHGRR